MKIKPKDKAGGVVVELGPREAQLPSSTSDKADASPPAFRLKRILVPVDFSDCSRKALQYAIPFARQFGGELTLLFVVQPYPSVPDIGPLDAESTQEAEEHLEAVCKTVDPEVPCKPVLRTGNPHLEIIDAAKELDIDLIIISTHGRSGLEHVLLGSTAEKVVRHAGCPVLIVREHEREFVVGESDGTANAEAEAKP